MKKNKYTANRRSLQAGKCIADRSTGERKMMAVTVLRRLATMAAAPATTTTTLRQATLRVASRKGEQKQKEREWPHFARFFSPPPFFFSLQSQNGYS